MLEYKALSGSEIRLMRILRSPDPEAEIECELVYRNLESPGEDEDVSQETESNVQYEKHLPPSFVALSYVWGDPTDTTPITINGAFFRVTRNLHRALRQLRECMTDSAVQELMGWPYLWVDAICINQSDMVEKSRQVPRMRDIYSLARDVIIWLGPVEDAHEDSLVREIFSTVNEAVPQCEEAGTPFSQANQPFYEEMFEAFISLLEEIPVSNDAIPEAVKTIFQRPWFSRIWVSQEAALPSHSPSVVMGRHSAPLDGILLFSSAVELKNRLQQSPIANFAILTDFLINRRRRETRPQEQRLSSSMYAGKTNAMANELLSVLSFSAGREASVPHDALYGVLSLANASGLPSRLAPDYTMPFERVYHEYAKFLFTETGNLSARDTKQRDLPPTVPTWVPDFRFPPENFFVRVRGQGSVVLSDDGLELSVEGLALGTIISTFPRYQGKVENSTMARKLLLEFERTYLVEAATLLAAPVGRVRQGWLRPWGVTVATRYEQFLNGDESSWKEMLAILKVQHFITDTELFGSLIQEYDGVRSGDIVCRMKYCIEPGSVILRPRESGGHEWVGTCLLTEENGRNLAAQRWTLV